MYNLAFRSLLAVGLQISTNESSLIIARTLIGQYSYSKAKIPTVKTKRDIISTDGIASNDKMGKEVEPVNQLKEHSKGLVKSDIKSSFAAHTID